MDYLSSIQECLSALLDLSKWAWTMLKVAVSSSGPTLERGDDDDDNNDDDDAATSQSASMEELSHIIFVCRVSMRLLRFYILELYPSRSIFTTSLSNFVQLNLICLNKYFFSSQITFNFILCGVVYIDKI